MNTSPHQRELPPHARRIRIHAVQLGHIAGTTSACAENTGERRFVDECAGNYLRMRGEYPNHPEPCPKHPELPPRARRIPTVPNYLVSGLRNYLRVRGEYRSPPPGSPPWWNYLRVRGEYASLRYRSHPPRELPPRARRIPPNNHHERLPNGTTSACAENTPPCATAHTRRGNYLRVRGEYPSRTSPPPHHSELPPRARRIPSGNSSGAWVKGTTSACAENTLHGIIHDPQIRNYLRVRGEYATERTAACLAEELPPRARRILQRLGRLRILSGTTSACAENTLPALTRISAWGNYLRVRGEYPIW